MAKRKKLFSVAVYLLLCSAIVSCARKRYITEIPYAYSPSNTAEAPKTASNFVEDNPQGLGDDTLRIKEKYSIIMGVMPSEIRNYKLYAYIDGWLGTPYKKQSLEKQKGVDASYFVQALFSDVYGEAFPKTPDGIFRSKALQLFTGRTFLREGDILFFRYDKPHPISDVGVYLRNDRILACTAKGLNIYDFNDEYFQLRYVAAGRLKEKK